MCGIAVAIGWEAPVAMVEKLITGIMHRGDITDPLASPRPDIAMRTRRLRIIDGANAIQPQASYDGRIIVAFNGEIYNHVALRIQLEALGIKFTTQSDTEVLANSLMVWGVGALDRFVGMFAFVAINIDTGEFLAARDPFGVKPLYVMQSASGYLFCSEMRPLLNATDAGDVMYLPPGHILMRKGCRPYNVPQFAPDRELGQSSVKELDRVLSAAVGSRVPADIPAAIMFSGGIDSTLLAHYARQVSPGTPGYILGASGARDLEYAHNYADQTGFDLRTIPFSPYQADTFALMGDVVETVESFEPSVVRGSLCSYLVSRQIHADGYRVALCGEGADELFAGYPVLEYVFSLGNAEARRVRTQNISLMHKSVLQRVDRCSMRFALEAREPFLDLSVAEYALRLDATALVHTVHGKPRGKAPLRSLYDLYPDELPKMIRDREKVGFDEGAGLIEGGPDSAWLGLFEDAVSDHEFIEGQKEFSNFGIRSKEELFYIRKLAAKLDISRVPYLLDRLYLYVPSGTPGAVPRRDR